MTNSAPPSACSRCGAAFTCGAANKDDTCWCFEMPRLKEPDFSGACLCVDCLNVALADQRASESTTSERE